MQYAFNKDGVLKGYFRGTSTANNILHTYFDYDQVYKLTDIKNVALSGSSSPADDPTITNKVKSIFSGFNYDGRGRLTGYNAKVDGLTDATERNISFEYDERGQLKLEKHHLPADGAEVFWGKREYKYDDVTGGYGVNLKNIVDSGTGSNTLTQHNDRQFNEDNRITADANNFDFNTVTGNPTKYAGKTMTYDLDDRLIKVDGTTTEIMSCGYYMDGKRAWKQGSSTGNTRTYFLYDGDQLLCEVKYDNTVKYYVTAVNLWGADGLAGRVEKVSGGITADELTVVNANNNNVANYAVTWYAYDQQGTVAQRFNADGTLKNTYACDAFGNKLAGTQETYSYNAKSGYYYDSEIGMYYCWHRYYDPANGRWLTEDPIGYEGGLNLYGYCGNMPVGSVDWSGKNPALVAALTIVGGGVVSGLVTGSMSAINAPEGQKGRAFARGFGSGFVGGVITTAGVVTVAVTGVGGIAAFGIFAGTGALSAYTQTSMSINRRLTWNERLRIMALGGLGNVFLGQILPSLNVFAPLKDTFKIAIKDALIGINVAIFSELAGESYFRSDWYNPNVQISNVNKPNNLNDSDFYPISDFVFQLNEENYKKAANYLNDNAYYMDKESLSVYQIDSKQYVRFTYGDYYGARGTISYDMLKQLGKR